MDPLGQMVSDFISKDGLATASLVFLGWFLTTRIWPWLTKEYWPARTRQEEARNGIMKVLGDNLIELKIGQKQMAAMIEHNHGDMRADTRVVLESLSALHQRLAGVPLASATAAQVILNKMEEKK